jgi:hypothetical protein
MAHIPFLNKNNGDLSVKGTRTVGTPARTEEHQFFTKAWRSAIGYSNQVMDWTTTNATPEKVRQVAQDIYNDYPALINAVRITLSK